MLGHKESTHRWPEVIVTFVSVETWPDVTLRKSSFDIWGMDRGDDFFSVIRNTMTHELKKLRNSKGNKRGLVCYTWVSGVYPNNSVHRSDASNVFTFMTIVIIISYILYTVVCGLSALSGLCGELVSSVILCLRCFMYLKNAMYLRGHRNYLYMINAMP